MFDEDLLALIGLWKSLGSPVAVICDEVSSDQDPSDRLELEHEDDGAHVDAVSQPQPRPSEWQNLVAFGEYTGAGKAIDEGQAAEVGYNAEAVANDYNTRGVGYAMGGNASAGGETSDCSHFVHDVLQRAGVDVPYTTTGEIGTSPHFEKVPAGEERAGDVIVQGGHMGVYSGEKDANGHPIGTQMGDHGTKEAPWGPGGWFGHPDDTRYYRPKQ
jgi:cell wall-associated NlpC family hydrolase